MILQFPDLETVRLVMTSGLVPTSVTLAAAEVSFDAEGSPFVDCLEATLSKQTQNNLKRLGVKLVKAHASDPIESIGSWPQILPLAKLNVLPELSSSAPVLFELPAKDLPELVGEMLRLGNDRQSFLPIEDPHTKQSRVLLRVIGPPYYTLLRAVDRLLTKNGERILAYVEAAPKVWIEIGYTHPLANQLRPTDGQQLLLRPPRQWLSFPDEPFQDVYNILDFQLPEKSQEFEGVELSSKLSVPLRLTAGNATDLPELWVLVDNGIDQLDELVRDADERLMEKLAFAVADGESGKKTVILRTRRVGAKSTPPALALSNAIGFRSFFKLDNLFLPVGTRLQPTLRRDAVRKLLADDPAQIVWLLPKSDGEFVPETLPDEAFRPLKDWIDYIIDQDHATLQNWMEATRFDFDSFLCTEEQTDKPKGPPSSSKPKPKTYPSTDKPDLPTPTTKTKKKATPNEDPEAYTSPVVATPPDQLKIQKKELENQFLSLEGALDIPERLELWPALADVYAALKETNDSALARMNYLWEQELWDRAMIWAWVQSENRSAKPQVTGTELDVVLGNPSPSPGDVRSFVAQVIWACLQNPLPSALKDRLPEIGKFLESNERFLSVRAIWLVWLALTQSTQDQHTDVLSLARTRDRLLNRLRSEGLNTERDLPAFLRFSGIRDNERLRLVQDKAMRLRDLIRTWLKTQFDRPEDVPINQAYTDLIFAFGLAKLGETTSCNDLIQSATTVLQKADAEELERRRNGNKHAYPGVFQFLLDAFRYRIETVLASRPHQGPLPGNMLKRLQELDDQTKESSSSPSGSASYVVARLQKESMILDPQERTDPYRMYKTQKAELLVELAKLPDIKRPSELEDRIRKLLAAERKNANSPVHIAFILAEGIELAHRVGEKFTSELLEMIPAATLAMGNPKEQDVMDLQVRLLERALFQAGHYQQVNHIQNLTRCFQTLLQSRSGKNLFSTINMLCGECLRNLRKLGMQDEIHKLLNQMEAQTLQGQTWESLLSRSHEQLELVQTMLHLAGGRMYFGEIESASRVLDEARKAILDYPTLAAGKLSFQSYVKVIRTYVKVLGQAPIDVAISRIEDLFQEKNHRSEIVKLPNSYLGKVYYSQFHVTIVEDLVLAIVNEDFVLGPSARRWLDEDEYLVRRRIHADIKKYVHL